MFRKLNLFPYLSVSIFSIPAQTQRSALWILNLQTFRCDLFSFGVLALNLSLGLSSQVCALAWQIRLWISCLKNVNVNVHSLSHHKSQNHATLKFHTCTAVFTAVFRAVLKVRTFGVFGGPQKSRILGFYLGFAEDLCVVLRITRLLCRFGGQGFGFDDSHFQNPWFLDVLGLQSLGFRVVDALLMCAQNSF